jgi:hypothetical protein
MSKDELRYEYERGRGLRERTERVRRVKRSMIFDGWLVQKNGHMTITILSIAHMGIPNILKISSLYSNNQLLIGPFPQDLSLNIYNECSDQHSPQVGTSLHSVSF